jgi:hypothetical protein
VIGTIRRFSTFPSTSFDNFQEVVPLFTNEKMLSGGKATERMRDLLASSPSRGFVGKMKPSIIRDISRISLAFPVDLGLFVAVA